MGDLRDGLVSRRCWLWTGPAEAPLERIVDADESELEYLHGSTRVGFRVGPRGFYLERGGALRQRRALFIDEEAVRMISVYKPSPFQLAVLVQVDVAPMTQCCVCFGRLAANSGEDDAAVNLSCLALNERALAVDLLNRLHERLPSVPLAESARELVAIAKKNEIGTTRVGMLAKRRRSLDPKDFYGEMKANPSEAEVSRSKGMNTDGSKWAEFYDRLRFSVSHSLLCQLEGTAPLSATFPRQQDAFEFADQVVAFRRRLASEQSCPPSDSQNDRFPRLFCFEGANEGKRRFWVTTMRAFWREYTATQTGSRHVYEIIREHLPCRLYFDLEFKTKLNHGKNGDQLVSQLISLLRLQLYRKYQILIDPINDIVQLDSSTPLKFSRHLTILFPDGDLFANNSHAGAFVRQLVHDLIEGAGENSPFLVHDSENQKQLFIDIGVYTRNRMFRVLGSSKFRNRAILRHLGAAIDNDALDFDMFCRSLVCPFSCAEAMPLKPLRLLRCEDSVRVRRYGANSVGTSLQAMKSVESKSSDFPDLDDFIRSIARTGGVQGEIRAVQLLYPQPTNDDPHQRHPDVAVEIGPHHSQPSKIVYHMMRNRWCENIGRPHKSNNVMFVVNVPQFLYFQKCHDPHCQASDYRSQPKPLPKGLELAIRARIYCDPQ